MSAKFIKVNPDLIETAATFAQANPVAVVIAGFMFLAMITYKWGF